MFNQRLKDRIVTLEKDLSDALERAWNHNLRANESNARNGELVKQLRDMDQLAYSISQCSSFEQMRSFIQQLCQHAASRQQAESARIRNVMIVEIKQTYGSGEMKTRGENPSVEEKL